MSIAGNSLSHELFMKTNIIVTVLCASVISFPVFFSGEGMKALRKHNIVHRDLKPSNILIKELSDTGKRMVSLLCL